MEEERKQKVIQCYHCGNRTLMNQVAEHIEDLSEDYFFVRNTSTVYICPICKMATYIEIYVDETMEGCDCITGEEFCYEQEKICYPVITLDMKYVPAKIRESFEGALRSRYMANKELCLVGLGITLEIICREQGATCRNLSLQLQELVTKNILPPTLKEIAGITRYFRNAAAHADEINITDSELTILFDFVKAIMDYIYVIPKKMDELEKRISTNKQISKATTTS